jgi:glycosyltransferase involved in cell wall biosynthesis
MHSTFSRFPSAGMLNQMNWEQDAARQLGLDWEVKVFCPLGIAFDGGILQFSKSIIFYENKNKLKLACDWFALRLEYYRWLKLLEGNVDVFLLRYSTYDPFQFMFVVLCKKPVCLVHHTLEIAELASSGRVVDKIKTVLESFIGRYSIRKSAAIVGVTREIIDYEKKRARQPYKLSILYPNGIMYSGRTVAEKRGRVPELLFVASVFASWHGVDLLLSSMQENKDKFVLHLVGNLSAEDKILAEKDKRVISHGHKSHQEIRQIAETCWLGLSSFALFRKDMKEACTLKVREYLMMGLPVYAGHKDTFPESFEFYRNGELSSENILRFASEKRGASRERVAGAARRHIDKVEMVRSLANHIRTSGILGDPL